MNPKKLVDFYLNLPKPFGFSFLHNFLYYFNLSRRNSLIMKKTLTKLIRVLPRKR